MTLYLDVIIVRFLLRGGRVQKKVRPAPLCFPESARRYWHHLVPLTAYPSIILVLLTYFGNASLEPGLTGGFFVSGFYAMWPVIRGKATFGFWFLAAGLYLGGGILGIAVVVLVRAIFGPVP